MNQYYSTDTYMALCFGLAYGGVILLLIIVAISHWRHENRRIKASSKETNDLINKL